MNQFDPIFFTVPSGSTRRPRTLHKGGGGGGGSSTQTVMNYSPEEAARRTRVQDEATRIYNATAGNIANSPYPGVKPVGLTGDQLTGQDLTRTAANTIAGQYIPQLAQATQFGLSDVLDPQSNPALNSTIDAAIRPITQSYTDAGGVLSNIRTGAINAGGQGNSTRQGIAEGIAAGRYADTIGDTAAKITSDAYSKGLDTFSKTYGLAPSVMSSLALPGQLYSATGSQDQAVQQAQEQYFADARNWGLNAPWLPLQNYANIVYGNGPSGSTTTSTGGGQQSNAGMGAIGGAMAGAQLGSMIPGIGTGIGAIGGLVLGGLFS